MRIILSLAIISCTLFSTNAQTAPDFLKCKKLADDCFNRADYVCAEKNYKFASIIKENDTFCKQRITEIQKILTNSKKQSKITKKNKVREIKDLISMIYIKGETFELGNTTGEIEQKPLHKVKLRDFQMSKYEVTQLLWRTVMSKDPSTLFNKNCDYCPIESVNWVEANDFIKKLNLITGKNYRLPTEAEWEYAAKGGRFWKDNYTYSGSNDIRQVAWYQGNYQISKYGTTGTTHPVGAKKPNQIGLYDMTGNVGEWCIDWFAPDWYLQNSKSLNTDPLNLNYGEKRLRVLRGGTWFDNPKFNQLTARNRYFPTKHHNAVGFRLVL